MMDRGAMGGASPRVMRATPTVHDASAMGGGRVATGIAAAITPIAIATAIAVVATSKPRSAATFAFRNAALIATPASATFLNATSSSAAMAIVRPLKRPVRTQRTHCQALRPRRRLVPNAARVAAAAAAAAVADAAAAVVHAKGRRSRALPR
jgi:hypothetical protein